jgi:exonuclease SbcD
MRDLREIRGTYAELSAKKNYENTNTDDYIHAVLTDENDVVDAIGKLRVIYPNLMKITYDNKRTREQRDISEIENIEQKTPMELFEEFYEKQNNDAMSKEQKDFVTDCIQSIWEV